MHLQKLHVLTMRQEWKLWRSPRCSADCLCSVPKIKDGYDPLHTLNVFYQPLRLLLELSARCDLLRGWNQLCSEVRAWGA